MTRVEPLLLSCAENDHAFDTASRRKALDILQREKKRYHLQLFQGASHGFAVRGDPADPYQRMPSTLDMPAGFRGLADILQDGARSRACGQYLTGLNFGC